MRVNIYVFGESQSHVDRQYSCDVYEVFSLHKKMLYLTIAILIFLTACGGNLSYKTELPEEPPQELLDFIGHMITNQNYFLFESNNTHFFSMKSFNPDYQEVEYFSYTDETLNNLYTDFIRTNLGTNAVFEFKSAAENKLFERIVEPTEYFLPIVQKREGNVLNIETLNAANSYDLTELLSKYDFQPTDEIAFNVVAVTEEEFQINIRNFSKNDPVGLDVSLFIKQDLSEVVVSPSFGDKFAHNLHENKLADFENLFIKLGPDENLLKTMIGYEIWDKEMKKFVKFGQNDYLNKSGEFVYLNGYELEEQDHTQHRIQKIEDYVDGNSEYYSEFKLDYEELGEEIGIDSAGAGIVEVMYLNDRYAVLYVNFALAITGTAGSTNVIVDLKDDTIYLVDLGLDVNTHAPISVSGE